MSLRITAGEFKGRTLKCLDGLSVRPTPALVREALFNVLSGYLPCRSVLDLYAGCGTLGLEALSRGAQEAVLVERDRRAAEIIRENTEKLGLASRAQLRQGESLEYLSACGRSFSLILADPPYPERCSESLLGAVSDTRALEAAGCMVIQHAASETLPLSLGCLEQWKTRRYGRTRLSYYRNKKEA